MAEVPSPAAGCRPSQLSRSTCLGPGAGGLPHKTHLLERSWETSITRGLPSEGGCLRRVLGCGAGGGLDQGLPAAVSSPTRTLLRVGVWILPEVQV